MPSISEEEKETIYELEDIKFDERTNKKIEIVLNLIKKLQKENKELKKDLVFYKEIAMKGGQ